MIFFLLIFQWLMPSTYFCSCVPPGPINEEEYNRYDLILKGRVSGLQKKDFEKDILFTVDTYYKGGLKQKNIIIHSPLDEGSCGIMPKTGEEWLIYAYADSSRYNTNLCTRTKNLNPKAWDYQEALIREDLLFLEKKRKQSQ